MTVVNETGQDLINEYFTRCSQEWEKLYQDKGVHGAIHKERLRLAITMVDRVGTAKRALDIGCGAGLATAEMARRGISVDAVDPVPAMIELTKRRVIANGLEERISAQVGDVNVLPFPDETFDIVLPWLPDMQRPLSEMVRVLRRCAIELKRSFEFTYRSTGQGVDLADGWHGPLANPTRDA